MSKVISNILLGLLAIGLTIFTGSRTLDLLAQWLPVNQQIMQWLGLAAFEGGLYFWAFYFVTAAKGSAQRGIALMMIVLCFVSVAVATVSDLLLDGSESGKLPEIPAAQKQAIVIFVGVVIVLNVAAFLAAKLTDPDKLREFAIQDAEDTIVTQELAMIRHAAPRLAAQMAPVKAEQWVNSTWQRMLPETARPMQMIDSTTTASGPASLARTVTPSSYPPTEKKGILSGLRDKVFGQSATTTRRYTVPGMSTSIPDDALEDLPPKPDTLFDLRDFIQFSGVARDHALEFILGKIQDKKLPMMPIEEIANATGESKKDVLQCMEDIGLIPKAPPLPQEDTQKK